jgi:hypothetical protein
MNARLCVVARFGSRVTKEDREPTGPNNTQHEHPGQQPAGRGWEEPVTASAAALEVVADMLEAEGRGGPAVAARATALLLHLAAVFARSNGQR